MTYPIYKYKERNVATIELCDEQLSDIVAADMRFHIEAESDMNMLEPELVDALWRVLEFYSIPSEFEEFKEKMKWKLQMENQV